MAQRLEFHQKLVEALGSRNVYFQPPESVQLTYPCIVYERSRADSKFGDNTNWMYTPRTGRSAPHQTGSQSRW